MSRSSSVAESRSIERAGNGCRSVLVGDEDGDSDRSDAGSACLRAPPFVIVNTDASVGARLCCSACKPSEAPGSDPMSMESSVSSYRTPVERWLY